VTRVWNTSAEIVSCLGNLAGGCPLGEEVVLGNRDGHSLRGGHRLRGKPLLVLAEDDCRAGNCAVGCRKTDSLCW